jgi:hypothetical protein
MPLLFVLRGETAVLEQFAQNLGQVHDNLWEIKF